MLRPRSDNGGTEADTGSAGGDGAKQDGQSQTNNHSYTLDGVGNRLTKVDGNTTYTYNYDADQELTSVTHGSNPVVTDYAYEYDSSGQGKNGWQTRRNLGTGADYDLVYDAAGQLRKIKTHGTTTVLFTYAYDGLGRRSSRKVGTGSTHEMLCELGLVGEEWVNPNVTADYGHGLGLFRRNSEFAVWDGHGDLRNSLSVDGNYVASVVSSSTYDAFGNRVAYDNSTGHGTYIPNQYCGLYAYRKDGDDPSTQTASTGDAGLMYVGERYYDTQVGRFTETDPAYVGDPFDYCGGNPVIAVDSDGLNWVYSQSSGEMGHQVGSKYYPLARGYSGFGPFANVPWADGYPNLGPIPTGDYTIGKPHKGKTSDTMKLTPRKGTNTHKRSGFLIHGDSKSRAKRRAHMASTGCIILGPGARSKIGKSHDHHLNVVW